MWCDFRHSQNTLYECVTWLNDQNCVFESDVINESTHSGWIYLPEFQ